MTPNSLATSSRLEFHPFLLSQSITVGTANPEGLGKYKKSTFQGALLHAIPLDHGLSLVPIGEWLISESGETFESFRSWRVANRESFASEISPSPQSFKSHLIDGAIGSHQRILFAIYRETMLQGHIGLSNVNGKSASLDNVMKNQLRGGKSRIDVMGISIRGLLAWGVSNLGINFLELVVRSDNFTAIELYDRLGFELVETMHLRVTHSGSHAEYVNSSFEESNTSVRKLVFQRRYPNLLIYAHPQG